MIIGVGVDLLDSRRVEALLVRQGLGARAKWMRQSELDFYAHRSSPALQAAKVFAAKEAAAKALSTYPRWLEIELVHDALGAPGVRFFGEMAMLLQGCLAQHGLASAQTWISLSDEPPFVVAQCVIDGA